MDTSDSENFESADEGIQSDEEICVKVDKKVTENPLTCKTNNEKTGNERELNKRNILNDKLGYEELEKTESVDAHENVHTASSSQNENICHISLEGHNLPSKIDAKKNLENLQFVGDKIDKENNSKDTEKCVKDIDVSNASKKNKSTVKSKLGTKINRNEVKFEETPKKIVHKLSDEKGKQNTDERKEFNIEENKQGVDENLWDDEELDWSLDGCLETEKTQKSWESSKQSKDVVQSSSIQNSCGNVLYKNTEEKTQIQSDSWGGWSSWGASVLSTATQSVSSITSQLTNVIETGIGAVDPEELAKIDIEEKKNLEDTHGNSLEENDNCSKELLGGFMLGSLVKLVENTGTKVISGGLDTLETIGKKTMEVLQEGDPGLKKKRAFLKIEQDKPVLSQILREAKEKAENGSNIHENNCTRKNKNYETLFDDHHGLVHLEALELLSKQCEVKLKSLQNCSSGEQYSEFIETMDQIKELCELPDEEDEEQISIAEIKEKLEKAVTEMNVQISYEKLVTNWEETEIWLSAINLDVCDANELHQQAIETLAQVSSMAMEHFHKIGELLLIKDRRSTADEADSLVQITTTLTSLIGIVAAKFSEKLNAKIPDSTNKNANELITNVFFEAANSSSYIQDAFQLLIPVLQVGAL